MNAQLVAVVLNAAFRVIASLRAFGMSNSEFNYRLERAAAGEEAFTVEQVQTKIDDGFAVVEEGRELDETDRIDPSLTLNPNDASG